MIDKDRIRDDVRSRGISRLCHFTPSRNLVHIATGDAGILATSTLEQAEVAYTPTDQQRLDGYRERICCSIEYPNVWYFDRARAQETVFDDWVVILVQPRYLWEAEALFCPRNAAAGFGSTALTGYAGFSRLFDMQVRGAQNAVRARGSHHLTCCPTDDQAEVLIPSPILLRDITGLAVENESQAKRETARFEQLGVEAQRFPIVVAPLFFDKRLLSDSIRRGVRPEEAVWIGN